ncbi:MAG: hypothetical protein BGO49_21755 [Planctomycetales bacterium 71-10]|nr:MAG: hypothetical protein BGO49_21755 [Planctomycetales bacterium 71-10]
MNVLIVGASTRAAAFSALRAGLRPRCLDLFADADLAARCPVARLDPDGPFDPPACDAWLYTGSMEARPDLVGRLASAAPLLGNDPDVLRRARDPWVVTDALIAEGLPTPRLRRVAEGAPTTGRWLAKSVATAGGLGVRWARDAGGVPPTHLQEFVEGPTFSALFVAAGGDSRLVGVARQFPGVPGAPFLYRGGVAPWPVPDAARAEVRRVGAALARRFALVGLLGVDFVLADGRPWVVEVNPRYTASVELFEYASRRPLMRDHVRACVDREVEAEEIRGGEAVGKRVIYAGRRLTFPEIAPPSIEDDFLTPDFADVPHPGAVIEAGEPVLTVLARAETPEECVARLDRAEAAWVDRLAP